MLTPLADLSIAAQLRPRRPKPESLVVEPGEFEVIARIGAKVVARAYRTGWGWHIPLPRRVRTTQLRRKDEAGVSRLVDVPVLERAWASCATRDGTELALTRLVLFGTT